MFEQFDFSKLEDQKRFEETPLQEKEASIEKAHEEAIELNELAKQKQLELEEKIVKGDFESVGKIISFIEENKIPLNLNAPEIINACQKGLVEVLSYGLITNAQHILSLAKENNIPLNLNTPEIINAFHKGLVEVLSKGWTINDAQEILSFAKKNNIPLNLNTPEIINACQKGLVKVLSHGLISNVQKILSFAKENNIPLNLNAPEIINACQKGLVEVLSQGSISNVQEILSFAKKNNIPLNLNTPEIINACQKGLVEVLSQGSISNVPKILSFAQENNINLNEQLVESVQEKINFCEEFNLLEGDEAKAVLNSNLDFNLEGKNKKELVQLREKITTILLDKVWPDEIKETFLALRDEIGLENAWNYLKNYNRHDALYFIPEMLIKIPDKNIIKSLLIQTAQDNSLNYEGLNSRQALSSAIKNFQPGWFEEFKNNGYFDNIKTFRKEVEKKRKLTPEILAKLNELKKGNPKVYDYAIKLINHPSVEMGAVIEFLNDPARFFDRSDSHANHNLQENLNPQSLTEVNDGKYKIDLTPEEVRDLLIEGAFDRFSVFKPFSKEYSFIVYKKEAKSKNEEIERLVQNLEKEDILAFINNNEKEVNKLNPQLLKNSLNYFKLVELIEFNSLKKYTKENFDILISGKKIENLNTLKEIISKEDISENELLEFWRELLKYKFIDADYLINKKKINLKEGINLDLSKLNNLDLTELNEKQKTKLKEIIRKGLKDLKSQFIEGEIIIRAEIIPHNDPRFATIGDDTHCCMPFGSGKHNVYMWNFGTGAFVISFRKGDTPLEEARIVTQSILTANKEIDLEKKKKFLELLRGREDLSLIELLGEDFLEKFYLQDFIISADNVEAHKNYIEMLLDNDETIIEKIYSDFFKEYLNQHPIFKKAIIGKGYSDYLTHLKSVPNSYLPLNLISYSDNLGDTTLELISQSKETKPPLKTGVQEINWQDVLAISYLKEKAYKDNPDLAEGTLNLQQIVAASLLASFKHEVSNLNLGYFNEKGVLEGYVLAYLAHEFNDKEIKIYIHDIAVNPEKRGGTIALNLFSELLKRIESDDKLKDYKIAMRCRDKTSYQLIQWFAKRHNYEIVLDKETEYGGEVMHYVEIKKK